MEKHDSFEQDLKMLQYFQDEFEYRHKHYWSIMERFFILFIIVATLPVLKGVFGIEMNHDYVRHVMVFEVAAVAIAVIQLIVLLNEGQKIRAINCSKYDLNRKMTEAKYHYYMYSEEKPKTLRKKIKSPKDGKADKKTGKIGLAQLLPYLIFAFQIIIVASILMITYC